METRPFGSTGAELPILSFGAQRIVDEHDCTEHQAIEILNEALDQGIRYFDTAWTYSYGQSEDRVGNVAQHRRQEMWIATKAWDRTRDGALRQLEDSLNRLRTNHVDEWRLHNVWSMDELDKCFASDGSIQAVMEAREQGMVRYASISGHTDPQVQIEALRRFPFDSALIAASVLDHYVYSFAESFLPVAHAKGVATIAMKVFALGKLEHVYDKALRYTLGLPVSTTIVGCSTMDQLRRDLQVARDFVPLSAAERLELFRAVLPLVTPANMPWKADDWEHPSAWNQPTYPRSA